MSTYYFLYNEKSKYLKKKEVSLNIGCSTSRPSLSKTKFICLIFKITLSTNIGKYLNNCATKSDFKIFINFLNYFNKLIMS